ncbi:MAG TPA: glycosyltransferase family 39 protein [Candidatus Omnitrophota bacterium]|nr:glycosyltransferase family 39 protein [Candidatus Omnitrophota bacterium]
MILHYLYQYVKFGKFTTFFLIVMGGILLFRLLPKSRFTISKWAAFLLIFILGLSLRIGWLHYSAHTPMSHWNAGHMLENDWINVQAIELAQNGTWFHGPDGLPSGRRPIGYPMFLALFYKLFGVHLGVVWTLNLILYGITFYFLFQIACMIFNENIALISGFLFAIYPMSVYSIKLITDEHLFLPFFYGGLWMLCSILKGRKICLDWLWLGLIFGYATMIRTHTIFMPFVVGFTFWLLKRPLREVLGKLLLVALVMQLINLPWLVRNYKVWKTPVLYTATAYYIYPQMNSTAGPEGGGHIPLKGEPGYSAELDAAFRSGNEGKMHQIAGREMKKWIREHPLSFLQLGTARLLDFMCFNRKSGIWALWYEYYPGSFDSRRPLPDKLRKSLEEYAFAFYYIVFFSSLIAMMLLVRQHKALSPITRNCLCVLGLCFLFWFAEHMVIYPDRKYRFPLEPLMLITTAYFFYHLKWPSLLTSWWMKAFPSRRTTIKSV